MVIFGCKADARRAMSTRPRGTVMLNVLGIPTSML
jgi:hypothetical protein